MTNNDDAMDHIVDATEKASAATGQEPVTWAHELKTDPEVFAAALDGSKTHEIRFNDRDFKIGDTLRLRETRYTGQEMRGPEPRPLEYTGREVTRVVSHVLEGYGLQPGWVILSFATPAPVGDSVSQPAESNRVMTDESNRVMTDESNRVMTDEERDQLVAIDRCDPAWLIRHIEEDTAYDGPIVRRVFELAKERARAILARAAPDNKDPQ